MKNRPYALATLLLLGMLLFATIAIADPSGATISSNSTDYGPTINPSSHTANRSTITTIVLNALQQDQHWKAYVGNVTGTLTLDDSNNNTIYDWTSITSPTGEVYASRSGSLDFGSVSCADTATISSEEVAMNMTSGGADNISATFNATDHTPTLVAGTTLSSCPMTSLYVNDASQGQTSSADFQEFLMEEATNSLVYVAILNDNTVGFDGSTYDFEMIVAESDRNANPYPYYFYVELG